MRGLCKCDTSCKIVCWFVIRFFIQAASVFLLWYVLLAPFLKNALQVGILFSGHIIGIIITALTLWLVEDLFTPRRQIYARWGLLEPQPVYTIRYMRIFAIIFFCIAALAAVLKIHLTSIEGQEWRYWSAIGFLASAAVASLGWLVTNSQTQQINRIAETENALRDMLQDRDVIQIKRHTTVIYDYFTTESERKTSTSVPADKLNKKYCKIVHTSLMHKNINCDIEIYLNYNRKCKILVYEYLNVMERVAVGIRFGRLDFNYTYATLNKIVLATYDKWALLLKEESDAKSATYRGKNCESANNETYEHFIWLAHRFRKRYVRKCQDETEKDTQNTLLGKMILDIKKPKG